MNIPWIIQGAFNTVLNIQEGVSGNIANGEFCQEFVDCGWSKLDRIEI